MTTPHSKNAAPNDSAPQITGLEELVDEVEATASEQREVSIDAVMDRLGRRSFAPLLLLAGLMMVVPGLSDIPGVPVMLGLVVILISSQVLLRRDHIWMPQWLLDRSADSDKVDKAMDWLRRPARFLDRLTKPRQKWLVRHAGVYVIATASIVVAAATPLMELVPFSASLAGIAIAAFGLSLVAEDGVIALIAMAFCVVAAVVLAYALL